MDASQLSPTTPEPVLRESEVCDWLVKRGLLRPCPFTLRLDPQGVAKWLKRLCDQLGPRYAMCTFENFDLTGEPEKASTVGRLKRFTASMPEHLKGGGGLVMFGNPGTGKDHLTAAILKLAVTMHRLSAYWIDGGHLYDRIAEAAMGEGDGLRRLQAELTEPHILAMSDPQPPKGDLSPAQTRRVRDIIDKRYRDGKSTWLTTNLDNRQVAEQLLTMPVLDRLKDGSGIVDCNWTSYRQQRKATW